MKVRVHVFITGKVQGVFYRVKTRSEAKKRNVVGWVRNLPDGRVEAVFEGKKEDVDKLIDYCRKGPQGAYVTKIDVYPEEKTYKFNNFEIRRTA